MNKPELKLKVLELERVMNRALKDVKEIMAENINIKEELEDVRKNYIQQYFDKNYLILFHCAELIEEEELLETLHWCRLTYEEIDAVFAFNLYDKKVL